MNAAGSCVGGAPRKAFARHRPADAEQPEGFWASPRRLGATWTGRARHGAATQAIHVAVMTRPDFAEVFAIVAMILDGLYGAGTAARVERGLGAWEDMYTAGASEAQAREAVTAWLAEENETITADGETVEEPGR